MNKDDLYLQGSDKENFEFNERVAEVFDDMLKRSIPFYHRVIAMTAQLLARHLSKGDKVYDLGCSTGSTLLELAEELEPLQLEFVGVDNSSAMIRKAALKVEMHMRKDSIRFQQLDITDLEVEGVGAVILNYTLQFIQPKAREDFLKKVYGFLRPGGVLILSEKIICENPVLNREYIELYHDFKRRKGYSGLEISRKRDALENVLIPLTLQKNRQLLEWAGFRAFETFFQLFNFASFVAIKE